MTIRVPKISFPRLLPQILKDFCGKSFEFSKMFRNFATLAKNREKQKKKMKRITFVTILLSVCVTVMAGRRTESKIKSLAQTVLQTQAAARGLTASTAQNDLRIVEQLDGITIVSAGTDGFVVITNDDSQQPVVGYSFSAYDEGNCADGFLWWKDAINEVLTSGQPITRRTVPSQFQPTVEPLLKTVWNQYYPYYEKCPVVNDEHCVTGCVPTALAQVLNYYRWPLRGTGSNGWMDFSNTTFEWGNMLSDYANGSFVQKDAVATLMYVCGRATDVNYQPASAGGSGASLSSAAKALQWYFGYDNPQILSRDSYSGDWTSIIYGDLSKGSPILYLGYSKDNTNPGHVFVLDGYDADGNVHVNWGWGGSRDGYFNIDALEPGADFSAKQGMIYNIRDYVPQPRLSATDIHIMGSTKAGTEHTLQATVTNSGTDFSGALWLFVSKDAAGNGTLTTQQNVSIASSTEGIITFSFTPATDGHYCLKLTTDSEGDAIIGKIYFDIGADDAFISFSDKTAKQSCISMYDLNGDNELSYKEAAAVTTLWFDSPSKMRALTLLSSAESFDELKYFTSVTKIPWGIFQASAPGGYISSLKSITLPPSVQTIEERAFQACRSLERLTFSDNTQIEELPKLALAASYKLKSINLPASIKTIGDMCFYYCESLESIEMPQSLVSIGEKAFYECSSLKDVQLNEELTSIGDMAFYYCYKLKKIVFPQSLQHLGSNSFLSHYAYLGLQDIYVNWKENLLTGTGDEIDTSFTDAKLHVPIGTKALYESTLPWSKFSNIIEEVRPSGDVNGDGEVNVGDIVTVCNVMAGISTIDSQLADVNGDGEVNVGDIVTICNIMAGKE